MLINQRSLEEDNIKNLNQIIAIIKSDIRSYIVLLFNDLERKDFKLKNSIFKLSYFNEKQIVFYINRVSEYINDLLYLKHLFRVIGIKYLKSEMILEDLNSLCDSFLDTLEIYLIPRGNYCRKQELFQLYQTIFESILDGAKDEYSLWHKSNENTFTCVNRMRIEVIIQRALILSYNDETIVSQRLMQNTYFQKSLQKIGKQKTRELMEIAIDTVKHKLELRANRKLN